MRLRKFKVSPNEHLKNTEWAWLLSQNVNLYLSDDVVEVTESEANAYYEAAQELYKMYVEAADYVLKNELFEEIGIPANLIEIIKFTWENDRNWHLYGRFDLSGGIDGMPIKLIEFNADTATSLPETALVQWATLKANGMDESLQFNSLFESLVSQFKDIKTENSDFEPTLLISVMRDYPEDSTNMDLLSEAAKEAGFVVDFEFIDSVDFSVEEGIFKHSLANAEFTKYDFWFKLVPWEFIGADEPDLAELLTKICVQKKAVILNAAYTLLFQSKGMLKILWDLYPNHPLLLETKYEPIQNKKCVQKVFFGREGANVSFMNEEGKTTLSTDGTYLNQKVVYQEYVDFMTNEQGECYQAGVFYAGEACALGFRKGGKILDDSAQFCGHIIV